MKNIQKEIIRVIGVNADKMKRIEGHILRNKKNTEYHRLEWAKAHAVHKAMSKLGIEITQGKFA